MGHAEVIGQGTYGWRGGSSSSLAGDARVVPVWEPRNTNQQHDWFSSSVSSFDDDLRKNNTYERGPYWNETMSNECTVPYRSSDAPSVATTTARVRTNGILQFDLLRTAYRTGRTSINKLPQDGRSPFPHSASSLLCIEDQALLLRLLPSCFFVLSTLFFLASFFWSP
jgi:hypothetical protein